MPQEAAHLTGRALLSAVLRSDGGTTVARPSGVVITSAPVAGALAPGGVITVARPSGVLTGAPVGGAPRALSSALPEARMQASRSGADRAPLLQAATWRS